MEQKGNISRREFFRRIGAAGVAVTGLPACTGGERTAAGYSLADDELRHHSMQ